MSALADAIGRPRPPIDLVARCEGLLAWIDIDSELATLLDEAIVERAGTRGSTSDAASLEFALADGSCVIELTPVSGSLHGQIAGGATAVVDLRTLDGTTLSAPVDEMGVFAIVGPPSGTVRLEFELIGNVRRIHTEWFVI
jgi:hypothetical protein